jgi:uncharacterized damage-inducible protein DinB
MEAIAGLDEEGFRKRHEQGAWTAAETLAHLLISEQRSLGRAKKALEEDNPSVPWMSDEAVDEEARSAQRMPVPQIVHGLLAQRRDVLHLFESLPADQLARRYTHAKRGELTVEWLFRRIAEHEIEHVEQIRTARQESAALA